MPFPHETPQEAFQAREIKTAGLCPTCASRGQVLVCEEVHSFGTLSFAELRARNERLLTAERRPCETCRPRAFAAWAAAQARRAA